MRSVLLVTVLAVSGRTAVAAPPCAEGNLDACAEEGALLISQGRWSDAAPMLQGACRSGGGSACYALGSAHARGAGPPRDLRRAASIFEQACEFGHARACGDLGWMYAEALGVIRDEARARAWMTRACDGGQARSCGELSVLLREGRGGSSDGRAAATRAAQGCAGGDGPSCVHAASAATERGDAHSAFGFASSGCTHGEGQACAMAGLALQRGQGVSADPPLGLRRFKDACRGGYGPGCTAGGLLGIELAAAQGDAGRTAAADAVGMLQRGCELGEKVACTVLEQAAGGPGPAGKD